ncbi:hypothetical protein PC121_g10687 [Phytophthora cactorum]|nr:hypothetical protein PC120_g11203 [Phytophthora cactorum]KAG3067022.1 hypothetical protein PC121_g10687 [Phytophthora cactorum]KAG4054073.1 hypothetical protein PC123_g10799 [Phytophthora cactorum]
MRLHSVLMMFVATLAIVKSDVSTADSTNLRKMEVTASINSINTVHTEPTSTRMLRGADTNNGENGPVYYYPAKKGERKSFIEVRLKKALTNPKKVNRLYERWYKRGVSAKQVEKVLDQSNNRELDVTYKDIAKGYAAYIKGKHSQQQAL